MNFPIYNKFVEVALISCDVLCAAINCNNKTKNNREVLFPTTPFFYKQSIFDSHPKNCLSFSKKSPQNLFSNCLVDGLLISTV